MSTRKFTNVTFLLTLSIYIKGCVKKYHQKNFHLGQGCGVSSKISHQTLTETADGVSSQGGKSFRGNNYGKAMVLKAGRRLQSISLWDYIFCKGGKMDDISNSERTGPEPPGFKNA